MSSPTQLETQDHNNDGVGSKSSPDSPTFGLAVEPTSTNINSHASAWEERDSDIVQSVVQLLSESKKILNNDSDASLYNNIQNISHTYCQPDINSVPTSSPVILAADTTESRNRLVGLDEDLVSQHQDKSSENRVVYENVVLPCSSSETCDDQNTDLTKLKSPVDDVSKMSEDVANNSKSSDSNNNDISNQSMDSILLPDLPAFVLDGAPDLSSAIVSRKYSTSSDSAASTKSSFIESESSSHKHEYVLDGNEERSENDNGSKGT